MRSIQSTKPIEVLPNEFVAVLGLFDTGKRDLFNTKENTKERWRTERGGNLCESRRDPKDNKVLQKSEIVIRCRDVKKTLKDERGSLVHRV
jgi:hypothetical protein